MEAPPYVHPQRAADGRIALRPPDPLWASRLAQPPSPPTWLSRAAERAIGLSYLADWLDAKTGAMTSVLPSPRADPELIAWLERLRARPDQEPPLDGWRPTVKGRVLETFGAAKLPPIFEEALEFTAFALDQFKERAQRDGASLVILATHRVAEHGERIFHRLGAMAEARDIPVIDQREHIVRQGGRIADANFAHDPHWNPAGHRWAAQALLQHLKRNQWVCGQQGGRTAQAGAVREPSTPAPS